MKIYKSILILLFVVTLISCSKKEEVKKTVTVVEQANKKNESELVRKGIIHVESIDHNHDGNIYECPMDWNVLSDKAGDCPVCGMELKEYTLTDIKKNLGKYGYKFKE